MSTYNQIKKTFDLKINYSIKGILSQDEIDEEEIDAVKEEGEQKKSKTEWVKRVHKAWFKCDLQKKHRKNKSSIVSNGRSIAKPSEDVSFLGMN